MFVGIVAVAKNLAIGRGGKLPWHYPADLKFFRRTTTGHAVVMGWSTWMSIGKALPDRLNIVISRNGEIEQTGALRIARSKEEAMQLTADLESDVFIIGGQKTYETFADEISRWIVTEVPIEVTDADTFMPSHFLDGFREVDQADLGGGLTVKVYDRK